MLQGLRNWSTSKVICQMPPWSVIGMMLQLTAVVALMGVSMAVLPGVVMPAVVTISSRSNSRSFAINPPSHRQMRNFKKRRSLPHNRHAAAAYSGDWHRCAQKSQEVHKLYSLRATGGLWTCARCFEFVLFQASLSLGLKVLKQGFGLVIIIA